MFLVQELIRADIPVWIDKPNALSLDADVEKKIDQDPKLLTGLYAGKSWMEQILAAIEHADCVIACFSRSFLDRYNTPITEAEHEKLVKDDGIIKREIAKADGEKLVVCRVDDISMSLLPRRLSAIEVLDLANGTSPMSLPQRKRIKLIQSLIEVVEETRAAYWNKVEKHKQEGLRRYGSFSTVSKGISEEASEALIGMINRDTAVHEIVNNCGPFLAIRGSAEAKPEYLFDRLPLIELPLVTRNPVPLREMAQDEGPLNHNDKARMICGQLLEAGRTWAPFQLSASSKAAADEIHNDLIARLVSKFPALHEDSKTLGALSLYLSKSNNKYFFYSDCYASDSRTTHKLIQKLNSSFSSFDPTKFRFVMGIHQEPALRNWAFWKKRNAATEPSIITLQKIGLSQTTEWQQLAYRLFEKPKSEIRKFMSTAFSDDTEKLNFAELESKLDKKQILNWTLRPEFQSATNSSSHRWDSDEIQAI